MSALEFAALPTRLEVRAVHLLSQQPGFRPSESILVTILMDPKRYAKTKLAQLYPLRWHATEVTFKHLKTTLKMELIRVKTPEKEPRVVKQRPKPFPRMQPPRSVLKAKLAA